MEDLRWPSGSYKSIAIINLSREQLERWFGRNLVTGTEPGLGEWLACGGLLPSGQMVEFVQYAHAATPAGFDLRCDSDAESRTVISDTLAALGLTESSIRWRCSE